MPKLAKAKKPPTCEAHRSRAKEGEGDDTEIDADVLPRKASPPWTPWCAKPIAAMKTGSLMADGEQCATAHASGREPKCRTRTMWIRGDKMPLLLFMGEIDKDDWEADQERARTRGMGVGG